MGLFLMIVSPINIAFPHREFGREARYKCEQDANTITYNNHGNSCLDFVLVSAR